MSLILHSMFNYSSSPGKLAKNPLEQLSYLSVKLLGNGPHLLLLAISRVKFYYTHGSYKLYFRSPGHYCFYQKLNATFVMQETTVL